MTKDSNFISVPSDNVGTNNSIVHNVYTVVVISQPTTALLDEAAKQRRYWHRMKLNSELNSVTFQNNSVGQDSRTSDDDVNDEDEEQRKHCHSADITGMSILALNCFIYMNHQVDFLFYFYLGRHVVKIRISATIKLSL